ncbi:hypothetical protein HZC53_03570 [Candidatus Uhrbacteria bacterium]|nr:hypothetical protein [Candidatus Uhrbacteria bacterium]
MADQPIPKPEILKPEQILPVEENLVEADQKAFERSPEAKDVFLEQPTETEKALVTKVIEGQPKTAAPVPILPADEVTISVEKIMEDGLGEYFNKLTPEAQLKFKTKGEETAKELAGMVRGFKVKFKRALQILRDWLLCVPGVNKFFLEQEAKIKVDRIIELAEARKEEASKKT